MGSAQHHQVLRNAANGIRSEEGLARPTTWHNIRAIPLPAETKGFKQVVKRRLRQTRLPCDSPAAENVTSEHPYRTPQF